MVTMGDVLAVAAGLFGICLATWALLVASTLLFTRRTSQARDSIGRAPGWAIVRGVLATGVGVFGLVLLSSPLPAAKLLGLSLVLSVLSVTAIGMAGLARIAADRIGELEPSLSAYACMVRGAAIVVIPAILPFLGWFVVAPVLLFVGAGAGMSAVFSRSSSPVIEAQVA